MGVGQLEDFERQTDERFQQLLRGARKKAADDAAHLELKIQSLRAQLDQVNREYVRAASRIGVEQRESLVEIEKQSKRLMGLVEGRLQMLDRHIAEVIGVAVALETRATQIAAKQGRTAEDLSKIDEDRPWAGTRLTDTDLEELRRGTA